jgi:UPF0042 nucleotide-binding protein
MHGDSRIGQPPCAYLTPGPRLPTTLGRVRDAGAGVATWVVTGMSGAGKATAQRALEAAGLRVSDNLPVALLADFGRSSPGPAEVAVVDARRGEELAGFTAAAGTRIVFLDAPDAVLVRRLADSTRPHPCASAGTGQAAVSAERAILEPLRAAADVVIDTGALTGAELAQRVLDVIVPERVVGSGLRCTVSSFGFKYGAQTEADWVIDSRILPNPFWDPVLRPLTGLDAPVRDYVLGHPESAELVSRAAELLDWVIGMAEKRGRAALHVAVGCTGGRHRSVVVAGELADRLTARGIAVDVRHRDVHRPDPRHP